MSVMPELSAAAVDDPRAYIGALTDVLIKLSDGAAHVRTAFGTEYLNFRAEDIGALKRGIVRLESLIATGQLTERHGNFKDPMPWLRRAIKE